MTFSFSCIIVLVLDITTCSWPYMIIVLRCCIGLLDVNVNRRTCIYDLL